MRTTADECNLGIKVTVVTTNLLCGTGSPLEAFPRLSVCHALLAKLPPSLMLVDNRRKPLLIELFPIICRLFDRYCTCIYIYTCVCTYIVIHSHSHLQVHTYHAVPTLVLDYHGWSSVIAIHKEISVSLSVSIQVDIKVENM